MGSRPSSASDFRHGRRLSFRYERGLETIMPGDGEDRDQGDDGLAHLTRGTSAVKAEASLNKAQAFASGEFREPRLALPCLPD